MTPDALLVDAALSAKPTDLPLPLPLPTLGKRIRAVRVRAGLSQADFAAMLGCSRQTLVNWEGDHVAPPITILATLRQRHGVDPEWLVMGDTLIPRSHPGINDWRRFDRIAAEVDAACKQFGIGRGVGSKTAIELTRSLFDENPVEDDANRTRLHRMLRAITQGEPA